MGEHELLEREAELGEITARLDGAAAGRGSVTAIVGPAGVGKTTLLVEARRSATRARGLSCLHAAGAELEASMPFGVVRGLFERTVVGLAETERAALMSGAARLAAPVLSLAAELERPQPADAGFAALHGLYWLSANLAQARRCCSRLTTRTGPTPPRCASWPTSPSAPRSCRSRCSSRLAASPRSPRC